MARLGLPAEELRAAGLPNASLRFREPRGRAEAAADAVLEAPAARSWGRRLVPSSRMRRLIGDTVRGAARQARRFRATTLPLLVDLEQRPHPENRVVLDGPAGAGTLPRARVQWRWTPGDEAHREALVARFVDAVEQAGWGTVHRNGGAPPDPNAHHQAGTTRMHADPEGGVVDPDLRVHGTRNLYVCGASVFPTSGALNPTLTALALTLRLADHLSPP
jgi:choline dehydrogenase-like flavoprotein